MKTKPALLDLLRKQPEMYLRDLPDTIRIPALGDSRADEVVRPLEDATVEQLGRARRVVIDKDATTLIGGAGERGAIESRMAQIRREIESSTSDYDREKLEERLAKLSGGVAKIKVGAATEVEMKEKKARVEDALHATRAAVEEGIVAGGGVALIRARAAITGLKGDNHDQDAGIKIVLRAMEQPLREIVANAGDEPSVVVDKVQGGAGNFGYNASTGQYGDMVEMGVLDPTKVTRTALQNAASVAGLMLTTECMVAELPEDKPAGGMPDAYCGYCPLLSALAPVLLALALFLPPLRRRLLPASILPTPHVPPLLRGLGARGPPILL